MNRVYAENVIEKIVSAERSAAKIMMHAHDIIAESKSGQRDIVTEYDKRVQEYLMQVLSESVPEARFFCEEQKEHDDLHARHLFIIDPIDGTMNFARGFNHSCISVAYMSAGELRAAAVYNPYVDEMFTAVKGEGAYLNGRRLHVSDAPLSDSVVCYGTSPYSTELADETFRLARIAFNAGLDLRREGSAELDLCSVAAGRAGLYFEMQVSIWDYAAGALLVREAVRLRDEEGLTAEEIAAVLEQFKKRVRIVAVVDSLKHLQKGGRLPAAVALVGGALGIKPVLALQDGAIKLVDKGRGRPGALVAMFKQLDALGGVDPRYGYTLLYSDNKQLIAPVHHYMHQNLQLTGGRVAQLGPTIGTHVGPGVVGVVFVAKE